MDGYTVYIHYLYFLQSTPSWEAFTPITEAPSLEHDSVSCGATLFLDCPYLNLIFWFKNLEKRTVFVLCLVEAPEKDVICAISSLYLLFCPQGDSDKFNKPLKKKSLKISTFFEPH